MMKTQGMQHLKIRTSKGFAFDIPHSVLLSTYPSLGIIFFLQCSVRFFDGSDFIELYKTENPISSLSLRGKILAIGEKMLKGQLTTTTVLNLETKKATTYKYQKTAVQSLSLSANCEYLCSVGSSDLSKQQLLIINLVEELEFGFRTIIEEQHEKKKGRIVSAVFSNKDPNLLALTFTNSFVVVRIDEGKAIKKIAKSSKVREFSMGLFDPRDISCYVASKNGDISEISIKQMKQMRVGPRKRVIISGIKHIRYVKNERLVITGVKGFIGLIELSELKILRQVTIKEEIISLTEFEGDLAFVATEKANIYILDAQTLDIKQFYSCHSAKVNQVCFLESYSEIFASCADREIVLWRTSNLSPIIKISLPNATCLCLNLLRDGTSIVSGWSDQCIRFWNPKTGKKMNQIANAHVGKVTALTSNSNSDRLYSGGEDGRIRSWKLQKERFGIIDNIFSGHKSTIHFLKLYGEQLISCSQDGTFAIWNHVTSEKKAIVKVSNFLKKIIPIDQYLVYGVGSGPNLLTIAKNDGRILEQIYVGGSHLNDFDGIGMQRGQNQKNQKFLAFGGQIHSVFLRQIDEVFGDIDEKCEQYSAYGQVTCVKFSPDASTLIAATGDGSLICYDFAPQGIF